MVFLAVAEGIRFLNTSEVIHSLGPAMTAGRKDVPSGFQISQMTLKKDTVLSGEHEIFFSFSLNC